MSIITMSRNIFHILYIICILRCASIQIKIHFRQIHQAKMSEIVKKILFKTNGKESPMNMHNWVKMVNRPAIQEQELFVLIKFCILRHQWFEENTINHPFWPKENKMVRGLKMKVWNNMRLKLSDTDPNMTSSSQHL